MATRAFQVEVLLAGILDTSGNALNAGKVYTYEAGTTTNKTTWTDKDKTTPSANPVILDAYGRATIFADGIYKFVVKDSDDNTLYTWDEVSYNQTFSTSDFYEDDDEIINNKQKTFDYIISSDSNRRDYATLAAYLADSPANGDYIYYNTSEAVSSALTFSNRVRIFFEKGAKLTTTSNITVCSFGDRVETEGTLLIETSHTGTIAKCIQVNGDDNYHQNILIDNLSTGTITAGVYIEAGKKSNYIRGAILQTAGTITAALNDNSSSNTNDVIIRNDNGGELEISDGQGDAINTVATTSAETAIAAATSIPLVTTAAALTNVAVLVRAPLVGYIARKKGCITYVDDDTVTINSNTITVKDKLAYWTSNLTSKTLATDLTPGNNTFYYLYADYSTITSYTALTNANFVWSATAPSAKGTNPIGYYNGDDLCLGVVLTDGSADILIFKWYYSGWYIYDAPIVIDTALSGGFTDQSVAGSIPNFGEVLGKIQALGKSQDSAVGQTSWAHLRANGSNNTQNNQGIYSLQTGNLEVTRHYSRAVHNIHTDSSQVIEYQAPTSGTLDLYTLGFFLEL